MERISESHGIITIGNAKMLKRDFPGGPVVKNLPANTGDVDLIPDPRTRIPHAIGQLGSHATTTEARAPLRPCFTTREATTMRSPCTTTTRESNKESLHSNKDPVQLKKKKKKKFKKWARNVESTGGRVSRN